MRLLGLRVSFGPFQKVLLEGKAESDVIHLMDEMTLSCLQTVLNLAFLFDLKT